MLSQHLRSQIGSRPSHSCCSLRRRASPPWLPIGRQCWSWGWQASITSLRCIGRRELSPGSYFTLSFWQSSFRYFINLVVGCSHQLQAYFLTPDLLRLCSGLCVVAFLFLEILRVHQFSIGRAGLHCSWGRTHILSPPSHDKFSRRA